MVWANWIPNPMCAPIVPENDLVQESCCPHLPFLGEKVTKWPFWSLGYNFIAERPLTLVREAQPLYYARMYMRV